MQGGLKRSRYTEDPFEAARKAAAERKAQIKEGCCHADLSVPHQPHGGCCHEHEIGGEGGA